MKKKIVWTDSSVIDLQFIYDYIANDAETYAPVFISEIIEKVEGIPDFPEIGRIVPEMNRDEIREIIFNNYRIIYKIKMDRIEILTIIHQRKKILSE